MSTTLAKLKRSIEEHGFKSTAVRILRTLKKTRNNLIEGQTYGSQVLCLQGHGVFVWIRRALGWTYLQARAAMRRVPGRAWLVGWTDPLQIAMRLLRRAVQERAHYAWGWLLDLGCGEQPHRDLFSHVEHYIGLDLPASGPADVYGDGMALPFQDAVFNMVLCSQVLEHVPEPSGLMAEVARVLKPGGTLLLTAPQTWGLHMEPHDFYRYTKYGLCYLTEKNGLRVIEVTPTCGLWATLVQRLVDTLTHTYAVRRSQWVIQLLSLLLAPILMVGYGLDKLFGKQGDTLDYVLVARKPDGSRF